MPTAHSQLVRTDAVRPSMDFFDQDVAPEIYTEQRRGDHFQNSLMRERRFNIPYWAKIISSSALPERGELNRRLEKADAVIKKVMVANGGKFEDWQVEAYLKARALWLTVAECPHEVVRCIAVKSFKNPSDVKKALLHIEQTFEACGHLLIRFQALVKSPLPENEIILRNADEAVRKFRHMEMDLPKRENSIDIWRLFQEMGERPGSQFVWTQNPANVRCAIAWYNRHGLKATIQGVPGNYVVTLTRRCSPIESNAAPKKPSPKQIGRPWINAIQAETLTNNPYWLKYFDGLPAAKRELLIQACKRATQELCEIMTVNGGFFTRSQFAEYELGRDPDQLVTRAVAACELLRIPVQILVACPISKQYFRTATEFRALDLGRTKCKSIGALVVYFKGKALGETAVLTAGPPDRRAAHNQAMRRGLAISVAGAHGNRLVTLNGSNERRKLKAREAVQSKRDLSKHDHLISDTYEKLIEGGPAVYVEGCKATLYRQLTVYFGPKSCSIHRSANRKGWNVKLLRITKETK